MINIYLRKAVILCFHLPVIQQQHLLYKLYLLLRRISFLHSPENVPEDVALLLPVLLAVGLVAVCCQLLDGDNQGGQTIWFIILNLIFDNIHHDHMQILRHVHYRALCQVHFFLHIFVFQFLN